METEELCSISISPLVTDSFAIQWSPDNQISLITDKGVHIFELIPSPMSSSLAVKFARSFVYPSDILPAHAFINQIDSFVWNLDRVAIYSLLMEETITPKLDSVNDTIFKISKIAWSPKNLISPNQCVLAILTLAGAVELLHKVANEWYSICDVSSLQLKIVQDEIKSKLDNCKELNNQYTVITESIRRLQACSMTWSELFKVKEFFFSYFSVAYCSGDIFIWKIVRISNFSESLQPVFIRKINLDTAVKINVLCWITTDAEGYLLVVGCSDGQIYGIKFKKICNTDDLEVILIEKYVTPDHISVNYLYVLSQDKSNIKVIAAKGAFLLLLCINLSGKLQNMQHLQVEGYNITGIIPVTAQQFMISTQNGHIFIIHTQLNDLICTDIISHLSQTHVEYLGLAHSLNKVIFVNVTSPNTTYDHLVIKEPSTMHIFTLKGAKDPLLIINNSANLTSVWDCMEVLRIKAAKAEDPSVILRQISEKLESSSLYDLQLSMWMTVMINVCTTKTQMLNMNHIKEGKISNALPLIYIHSICTYIDNAMKKNKLSMDQVHAVSLLNKYLKMYIADQEENENAVHQYARKTLNKIAFHPNQIEKCNLCDEVIDEFWNIRSCPQGHKLPRCTLTLLQITSLEYRECSICSQIFHSCLDEIYEEPQCPFCDVPLLHNSYGFDIEESKLYGRNLSQLRINITESKDDLEEQFEKPRKDKWNTSHTYSVIVNDNDDESARITETWEKF